MNVESRLLTQTSVVTFSPLNEEVLPRRNASGSRVKELIIVCDIGICECASHRVLKLSCVYFVVNEVAV